MKSASRAVQIITLVVTGLGFFMVLLDSSVVLVALPTIQADLHAQLSGLQWTIDAYTLPLAALMLTTGSLGDRFGRKRVFIIGLILFLLGSICCGTASTLNWLIFGRVVQGVGAAALSPGSLSLLVSTFSEPRARAQAIGIWSGISGVSLAAGPLIGGLIIQTSSWPAIFFINIPVGIVALALGIPVLIESRNQHARKIDFPGQILVIGVLTCLIMALIEGSSQGWNSPLIIGLFIASAVLLIAFLLVESRVREPLLPLSLFANRVFSVANLAAILLGFVIIGAMFFLSQYFQEMQGDTALEAGLHLLPITLSTFVASPFAARVTGRIGPRIPIALGAIVACIGLFFLLSLQPDSSYITLWWKLGLLGIGIGFIFAPLTVAILSATPPAHAGLGSSMLNTFRQIGVSLGTAVLGAVVLLQFSGNINAHLIEHGVPASTSAAIASKIAGAGAQASHAVLGSHLPLPAAIMRQVISQSFVDALHSAFLISAVIMVVIAAMFTLLIGRIKPQAARQPEKVAPVAPVSPVAPVENTVEV